VPSAVVVPPSAAVVLPSVVSFFVCSSRVALVHLQKMNLKQLAELAKLHSIVNKKAKEKKEDFIARIVAADVQLSLVKDVVVPVVLPAATCALPACLCETAALIAISKKHASYDVDLDFEKQRSLCTKCGLFAVIGSCPQDISNDHFTYER